MIWFLRSPDKKRPRHSSRAGFRQKTETNQAFSQLGNPHQCYDNLEVSLPAPDQNSGTQSGSSQEDHSNRRREPSGTSKNLFPSCVTRDRSFSSQPPSRKQSHRSAAPYTKVQNNPAPIVRRCRACRRGRTRSGEMNRQAMYSPIDHGPRPMASSKSRRRNWHTRGLRSVPMDRASSFPPAPRIPTPPPSTVGTCGRFADSATARMPAHRPMSRRRQDDRRLAKSRRRARSPQGPTCFLSGRSRNSLRVSRAS